MKRVRKGQDVLTEQDEQEQDEDDMKIWSSSEEDDMLSSSLEGRVEKKFVKIKKITSFRRRKIALPTTKSSLKKEQKTLADLENAAAEIEAKADKVQKCPEFLWVKPKGEVLENMKELARKKKHMVPKRTLSRPFGNLTLLKRYKIGKMTMKIMASLLPDQTLFANLSKSGMRFV